MERTIFPDLKLFKKTVREHFLVALRAIYKDHPAYAFLENDPANTRIHILPTYGDVTFESKAPRMLVKVGSYDFALQDTLFKNVAEEVKNISGVIGGYKSYKNMQVFVTVNVRAYNEEESSDVADELVMLAVYAAHHMFTQVGINIIASSVSETNEVNNENDLFDTSVTFRVEVAWELKNVSGKEAIDPETDIILPDTLTDGYRQPGAYVERGYWASNPPSGYDPEGD